jgi:coproporphyrinogen III oxidase-like Fe-S oxidoreductase
MTTERLPATEVPAEGKSALALYLHIPFCTSKCG